MEASPSAPAFSPMSDWEEERSSTAESSSKDSDSTASGGKSDGEDVADQSEPRVAPQQNPVSEADTEVQQKAEWNGFILVGDNWDKNVRPSFQRITRQTRSLHEFHSYAVKDRVDWSQSSDAGRCPSTIKLDSFLMTAEDWNVFKDGCSVLVQRYAKVALIPK